MAHKLWAGLDVGAETTSICVIDEAGDTVREATCPTTVACVAKELAFLRRRRCASVGLESGLGFHLAHGLRDRGYTVEMFEARQLSKFLRVRRNKSDAGDANGIAQAGRLAAPLVSRVFLKSFEGQALLARLKIRRFMIRERNRSYCVLCRQLEQFGGRLRVHVRSKFLRDAVEAEIARLFGKTPSPLTIDLRRLLDHCTGLVEEEEEFNRELKDLALQSDVCRRFMEIPGVGPICALTFTAAIDEPARFKKAVNVGSYLGLTPRLHQSGLSRKTGRISRMGNREARHLLVQAGIHFMRSTDADDVLHSWTQAIELRRGKGKSRVALARKLATIMIAIWKTGDHYRPQPAKGLRMIPL
jgi:transposase